MPDESPGIGGVKGLGKPSTRAPRAWQGLMRETTVNLPRALARSQKNRARLRRIGRG